MIINKKSLTVVITLAALSACSSVGVGQDDFNCSSGDDNALCASTRTIYKATNGEIEDNETITYIKNKEVHQTNLKEIGKLNPNLKGLENNHSQPTMQAAPQFSYDGDVLRHDVKVLRVWIAPWIDRKDNLHSSQLIYTDIEGRKWEIGRKSSSAGFGGYKTYLSKSSKNSPETIPADEEEIVHRYRPSSNDLKDLANAGKELMENINNQ